MKIRAIFYLIMLITLLNSCKAEKSKEQEIKKEKSISKIKEKKRKPKLKNINLILTDSLKQLYNQNLFNTKLTSLSLRDKNEVDIYIKYEIDFNHLCYPSALSLFIDSIEKKIYAFQYEDEDVPITKRRIDYILNIKSIIKIEGGYNIICNELESFLGADYVKTKLNDIEFSFIKLNSMSLYKLEIREQDLKSKHKDLFGRYNIYVRKAIEDKFHKDDCGDFEG
ncbi:hypothetical protein [Tenacibaculum finnmarkense]|uniref:hypothetical protein n=1 Tax=Tenacibaculum finnmarkense TaxID=2781243 RepID=UPI000C461291|nr:hypothetical protein [Tenacibaculum finnmarkense]MCD8440815.1 hypothetical protein [Tenacibaculum finnmarkense genomovar ulcerans]MCG8721716.1 hypothetical protein [Tenacibaculum finnmarkense]SOS55842.1 hypothetical protein TFHFJT_430014 [Tenacibaculum finnmarkense]